MTVRMRLSGEGDAPPRRLGLFLAPNFSMMAFASLIEPLRAANRVSDRTLYEWPLFSEAGGPIAASNGVEVAAQTPFARARDLDMAVVCAGVGVERNDYRAMIAALRRLASFGASLGAACTGTWVLAKAGLLDGRRATIHWENQPSFAAQFPELEVTPELFVIDGKRYTCAGGTAAIDMMLAVIREDHGPALVARVTDMLIHHRTREAGERQRMDLRARLGVAHPKLLAIVEMMENTVEDPMSCAQLAQAAGISTRQLERLFEKHLGRSPTRHYLNIRLEHARRLLRQTSLPVIAVAETCGFVSPSHFSKSYLDHFQRTPTAERKERDHPPAHLRM